MTTYILAKIKIHDRETYAKYEAGFMEIFSQYKGRVLAVDESPAVVEGEWPYTRTVIVEFPSQDEANAWFRSDAYQALARHRHEAAESDIAFIQGLG